MFKIYKGGEYFYQWDLGQRLLVTDPEIVEVHFCNQTGDCALVTPVYEEDGVRLANVPNVLLQNTKNIRVYGCIEEGTSIFARDMQIFRVIARGKPDDYAYTEEDIRKYEDLEQRIEELEENGGGGGSVDLTGYATEEYVQQYVEETILGGEW